MKRTFYYLLFAVLPLQLSAQTILPETHNPGSTARLLDCNFMPPGTGGTGQTWDFTALQPTPQDTIRYTYLSFVTGFYPSANMVRRTEYGNDNDYEFMQQSSTGVFLLGEIDSTSTPAETIDNPDSRQIMQYPFSASTTFNDAYSVNGILSGVGSASGTTKAVVDGTGTLKLPIGTFNNVIRMRIQDTLHGSIAGVPIDVKVVHYVWYDNAHTEPLLAIDSSWVDAGSGPITSQDATMFYSEKTTTVGIGNTTLNTVAFNAAITGNDIVLNMSTPQNHIYDLVLFNSAGQKVYSTTFTGGSTQRFTTGKELLNGIYMLGVCEHDGSTVFSTQKLAK